MHERAQVITRSFPRAARPATGIVGRPRWWQWPTILSLDAPAVAVCWQSLFARVAHTALGRPQTFVLGASVWLAYAADRWIEGWRLGPTEIRTERHHFSRARRWPLLACWSVVVVIDVGIACAWLTRRDLCAGVGLLALVLAYLLSHQFVHRDRRWRVPKEACVAGLLTGGVAVFVFAPPYSAALAAPLAVFGLLCVSNCALISAWERDVDLTHDRTSLSLQFRCGAALSRWLPWAVAFTAAIACGLEVGAARDAAGCALSSSILLGVVDIVERRAGRKLARVLADVALMTPLVLVLFRP